MTDDRTLSSILVDIITKYTPAVAAFPWTVGDKEYTAMQRMQARYKHQEVAPLTGFDSGMILYHSSVVDFFIPFMPRGEGGFSGKWSLCAHYLNMFAPLTFKVFNQKFNSQGECYSNQCACI